MKTPLLLAPALIAALSSHLSAFGQAEPSVRNGGYRPFESYAFAVKAGTGGIGGELATPLAHRLNLRVGAQAFKYTGSFDSDGVTANADLALEKLYTAVDIFPFHGGFHLSPGVTFHNGNHVAATLFVPGGQTLTLGDTDYQSAAGDPIHGSTRIVLGNRIAPRLTAGFTNVFPRSHGHWSFPGDIGFEHTTAPTMALTLAGSGCSDQGCGPIDSPDNQANIQQERQKIVNDLKPLRFYPIVSFGVSYRLGR